MKTEKSPSKWLQRVLSGLLLLAVGVFIWLPHRTQLIEAHSTLQVGKKMDVRLTLQSVWGWATPSRLIDLSVRIDGKNASVPRTAYFDLKPLDASKSPKIIEQTGFPEIVMPGQPGSSLTAIYWRFQNYSFSELGVLRKDRQEEVSYYAMAQPLPEPVRFAQNDAPNPIVIISKDSIKTVPLKERKK
jgi:hypothetical protein